MSAKQIVSVGFDRVMRLWKYDEGPDGFSASMTPQLELYGHSASVDSVAVHKSTSRLLTASSDHSIGLWSTRKSEAPPAPEDSVSRTTRDSGKRRKLNPAVSVVQRGPLSILRQHTQQTSGAIFDSKDSTVAYSVSWDQTMRTWDLVTSAVVDTRATNQALLSVEQMPDLHLIATGTAGRDVKLIDPRASASSITAMTLRGHRNSVVCLARDPMSGHTLASGSHDGHCRVWDLRNTKQGKDGTTVQSLYTIPRQSFGPKPIPEVGSNAQVYGLCWDAELGLLSAGQDKSIQINRSEPP